LGEDAYPKVLQRVLSALCTTSSREKKTSSIVDSEANLDFPEIKSDPVLRTSSLSDLVKWKDLSVLPWAEDDLFLPPHETEGYLNSNMLLAISSLDQEVSVLLLSRALKLMPESAQLGFFRARILRSPWIVSGLRWMTLTEKFSLR
jgi:hypothetical protein